MAEAANGSNTSLVVLYRAQLLEHKCALKYGTCSTHLITLYPIGLCGQDCPRRGREASYCETEGGRCRKVLLFCVYVCELTALVPKVKCILDILIPAKGVTVHKVPIADRLTSSSFV